MLGDPSIGEHDTGEDEKGDTPERPQPHSQSRAFDQHPHDSHPRSAGRSRPRYATPIAARASAATPPERSTRVIAWLMTSPSSIAACVASMTALPVVVVSSSMVTREPGPTGPTSLPPVP